MSDVVAVVKGAQVALTLVRDLQRLVNAKHQDVTLVDVQKVVQRNLDAELDWDASKARRLAELEAEKKKPKTSGRKTPSKDTEA